MIDILLNTQSKKREVIAFLEELKELLGKKDFNIDSDLTLIKKKKPKDEEHSTPYTLLDLDPPLLFVFGKDINGKLVYVKLKIKGKQKRRVLCVSFHYAKDPMKFPYA